MSSTRGLRSPISSWRKGRLSIRWIPRNNLNIGGPNLSQSLSDMKVWLRSRNNCLSSLRIQDSKIRIKLKNMQISSLDSSKWDPRKNKGSENFGKSLKWTTKSEGLWNAAQRSSSAILTINNSANVSRSMKLAQVSSRHNRKIWESIHRQKPYMLLKSKSWRKKSPRRSRLSRSYRLNGQETDLWWISNVSSKHQAAWSWVLCVGFVDVLLILHFLLAEVPVDVFGLDLLVSPLVITILEKEHAVPAEDDSVEMHKLSLCFNGLSVSVDEAFWGNGLDVHKIPLSSNDGMVWLHISPTEDHVTWRICSQFPDTSKGWVIHIIYASRWKFSFCGSS